MEKLIIFYQSFYENLLRESIRDDIEILAWIPCDTIPAVTDYIQTHFSLFQTTNLTICLMTSKFQIQAVIHSTTCIRTNHPVSDLKFCRISPPGILHQS
jgi:hypothetical protein